MQRARLAILSGILFLSGVSALVFQTLWLRLSGLAFGNSVWSTALILSSFMAGLAIGNAIASGWTLRRPPLRVYALLELAVAGFGCTIVFVLPLLGEWLRPVFQALWAHQAAINGLRFLLSFAVLLVPTTAMGLTLPVLLEDGKLRNQDMGRAGGFLYGWNTLGAVAGAVLGETCLIEAFGLWGTGLFACLISATAALVAWTLSARDESSADSAAGVPETPSPAAGAPWPWRLLLVSAGTGGILLGLEVVWFRFLRLYVTSSSTAFSIMLAVVLAGIGLGSLAAGSLHRRWPRSGVMLPMLLLAAALLSLLSYVFFPLPAPQGKLGVYFVQTWSEIGWLSLALMFPTAFLSGMIFPTVMARIQTRVAGRMNSAGLATLFNTIGAAAGPLLASFVLLPQIGFQWSLLLGAAGYALLAGCSLEQTPAKPSRLARGGLIGLSVALALGFGFFPYHRDAVHFANARRPYESDGSRLVKKIEGTADTLQLLQNDVLGEPYYHRLVTNGFSMSSTHPRSQRYMRLFAYLPLALRPEAEDALLICYGVGVTADALARDPQLKRIDIVDIAHEVFALAPLSAGASHSSPLNDPRVHAEVQDGRFFLQASPRQYDLITGEPPPLKMAGAVNLYTEEFFRLMHDRLKEGGIATFWLPIYQLKVDEVKAVLLAFHRAFPTASVWGGPDHEWIMLGIKGPGRPLTAAKLRQLWTRPGTGADLVRNSYENPVQFGALFLLDGEEIDRITHGIEPLTDLYPKRLSDAVPDMADTYRFAAPYLDGAAAFRRFTASPLMARIWPRELQTQLEPFFFVRDTLYTAEIRGGNWLAELDLFLRNTRLRSPILDILKTDETRLAIALRRAQEHPSSLEGRSDLLAGALARRDLVAAIHQLEADQARGILKPNDFFLLTYLYCLTGQVRHAEQLVASAGPIPPDWFVDWLWKKLAADFGFHPPT